MTSVSRAVFDVSPPPLRLEAGATVEAPVARIWAEGPAGSLAPPGAALAPTAEVDRIAGGGTIARTRASLAARRAQLPASFSLLASDVPVVLVVHALTGDMRAGGDGGWWTPLIGPGRALDTSRNVVLCINNLGSCYGSTGPADEDFPTRTDDAERWRAEDGPGCFDLGASAAAGVALPATITTWDQARFILDTLDALGIGQLHAVTGGSVGGMTALCLAMLAPERIDRLVPVAASMAADAWIQGWNHTARMLVLQDAASGTVGGGRGLELARQIAHMSYRAPAGLGERQGRRQPGAGRWSAASPYAVQTYLEYQGRKLRQRFHAGAYLAQLDAMDHHDMFRRPPGVEQPDRSWTSARLEMPVSAIGIDSDMLYPSGEMRRLAEQLQGLGHPARYVEITSPHGHDAFLIEWSQMELALTDALAPDR